jgi:hypothetical protein
LEKKEVDGFRWYVQISDLSVFQSIELRKFCRVWSSWAAFGDSGRKKLELASLCMNCEMEHFFLFAKEYNLGRDSLRQLATQKSAQKSIEWSLPEQQTVILRNKELCFRISFHQKEPEGCLACGGVLCDR